MLFELPCGTTGQLLAALQDLKSSSVCFVADAADFTVYSAFYSSQRLAGSQNSFEKWHFILDSKGRTFQNANVNIIF